MKRKIPILIGLCCLIAIGVSGQTKAPDNISFNSISKEEVELLLADLATTNPMILKRFAEDPEMKKGQIENLKQLLAFASQAQKDGLADDPTNRQELDNIKAEIIAVNYDREINKNKAPIPFGYITDARVAAYWSEGPANTEKRPHEAEFNDFLNAKTEVLRASWPSSKDRQMSVEEKTQARDMFAKIRIYKGEYEQKVKSGELSKEFVDKANLQVKLQQAQFLARLYAEKVTDQTRVTDDDIAKYIAAHPELDTTAKRAKAQSILDHTKAGENFAALANKFSEDPGKKGLKGKLQGGIYVEVPTGKMVPEFENGVFENAVLALEPGQIAPSLVETDFGYHIIKLERKRVGKDTSGQLTQIYDVRHILISTSYKDPTDASARDMPVRNYVRNKLAEGKEKLLVERLVVENKISVPDDFTVPVITEERPTNSTKKARVVKKRPVKKRR